MAPIRRYLRISKYSVLECRIYLEYPGLADSWLLNPRDPVLPRVFESVRPLVLPKLREENERAKGKGKKANRGIKDVVIQDDFEVSIFLTDVSARHSLLTKQKVFGGLGGATLISSSKSMSGGTNDSPVDVDLSAGSPVVIREESTEMDTLESIPAAHSPQRMEMVDGNAEEVSRSQLKQNYTWRKGKRSLEDLELDNAVGESPSTGDVQAPRISLQKRKRLNADSAVATRTVGDTSDDKKLALHMSYDGFSIYGRILCLVVKRKSNTRARGSSAGPGAGHAMVEDWIVSTQVQHEDSIS